jgi:hypothetical protein
MQLPKSKLVRSALAAAAGAAAMVAIGQLYAQVGGG